MKKTDWLRKNDPHGGKAVLDLWEMSDEASNKIDMGKAFFKTNMLDQAIECFEEALQNEEQAPDALFYLGVISFKKREYEKAVSRFKKLLEIRTDSINIYNNLAISLEKCNLCKEAMLVYNTGLKITPSSKLLLGNRGVLKYKTGDYEGAMRDLRKSIKRKTGDLFLYHYLSLSLIKTARLDDAKEILEEALSIAPTDTTILNNLGYLCIRLGFKEDAKRYLKEAIRNSGGFVSSYINLAWLYAENGKLEMTLLMLRKAFPRDDSKVIGHISRLADFLTNLGREEEAAYLTKRTIEIADRNQNNT